MIPWPGGAAASTVCPVLGLLSPDRLRRGVLTLLAVSGLMGACSAEHPLTLSPPRGGQGGGHVVRIEGEGFTGHGPVSVYFGVKAAKAVVIESPWLVTVLTPQIEEPSTVDVRLRFGDGTELELPQAYTYEEEPGIVLRPEIGG